MPTRRSRCSNGSGWTELVQTPATVLLDESGVAYEVHRYEHDPAAESYGMEAVAVLGVDHFSGASDEEVERREADDDEHHGEIL